MTSDKNFKILVDFLNTPLENGDDIFSRFTALPNAIVGKGEKSLERFVYVPGSRKDRVLLVAHIDTVWDNFYQTEYSTQRNVIFENDLFKSDNKECGIGADDRAGCAMLWALRESGHSLLITDGEERGKIGANFLKKQYPKLFKEINHHRFVIEFDWQGTNCCLFNQVDNTPKFKNYIEKVLGFTDSKLSGGCDIAVLCQKICGVNLGVGYHMHHTNKEYLVFSEWHNTLDKVSEFLQKPQPKFSSLFFAKYVRFAKRVVSKVLRILKIKK